MRSLQPPYSRQSGGGGRLPRGTWLDAPGVAHTDTAGRFAYVWADNRASGLFHAYTRVGQASP